MRLQPARNRGPGRPRPSHVVRCPHQTRGSERPRQGRSLDPLTDVHAGAIRARHSRRIGTMAVRVGINGFGRIGRQSLKALIERTPDVEVVAVNDLVDTALNALLFKHDSTYGAYPGSVEARGDVLVIDGREIKVLAERDPAALPWGDLGVDIVIESTGLFTKRDDAAKHLAAGAQKVIISAPATEP